jgi:hypothetical protein
MHKTLIISNLLRIGGAEKLLFELASFSKENNIKPTVLILDNYDNGYYDNALAQKNIKVVHTSINNLKHFRAPLKMLKSICWSIKLKYFAPVFYNSIHVIGLYNVDKVLCTVIHDHRFFWNVNNRAQFARQEYAYHQKIFENEKDTIVMINSYQKNELFQQYGKETIKARIVQFNLFINDDTV